MEKLSEGGTYRKKSNTASWRATSLCFTLHSKTSWELRSLLALNTDEREMKHCTEVKVCMPLGVLREARSRNSKTIQRGWIQFTKQKRKEFSFQLRQTCPDFLPLLNASFWLPVKVMPQNKVCKVRKISTHSISSSCFCQRTGFLHFNTAKTSILSFTTPVIPLHLQLEQKPHARQTAEHIPSFSEGPHHYPQHKCSSTCLTTWFSPCSFKISQSRTNCRGCKHNGACKQHTLCISLSVS